MPFYFAAFCLPRLVSHKLVTAHQVNGPPTPDHAMEGAEEKREKIQAFMDSGNSHDDHNDHDDRNDHDDYDDHNDHDDLDDHDRK